MVSSRANVALAAVFVIGLLTILAVGTNVLPNPFGPDRIEGTPEPFATTTDPGVTTLIGTPTTTSATATTASSALTTTRKTTTDKTATRETATPTTMNGTGTRIGTAAGMGPTHTAGSTHTPGSTPTTTPPNRTSTTTPPNRRYERARVTLSAANGTRLATVRTWIADTEDKRYTGLSNTGSLANGTGMLFVYGHEQSLTYVMRRMDYPLDIVFIGADRRINRIRPAPAPDPGQDGNHIRRSGSGKWVLEVPRGWMGANGITEGDRITINRSS